MQQPYGSPPGYTPPPPSRSPWPLILGIGCGGCALLIILAFGGLYFLGRSVIREVSKPGVPPPPKYVGTWVSPDSRLTILADGHGSFNGHWAGSNGTMKMNTARIDINPAAHTLGISILGVGPTFHIDKEPHEGKQGMEMTLDGAVYRQALGAPSNGPPNSSGTGGAE